jgi:zinc transport system ATP-binding protein
MTADAASADRLESVAVCLHDVTFSYGGEAVLKNINLDIFARDFACVVGPNGGGKTTLLKLIVGALKPQSGRVRIFGTPPEKAVHQVGYTPQHLHFDPLFPISVLEVVLMGRLDHLRWGAYRRADREAAMAALNEVGMAPHAKRPFSTLSGGERQRVLIARALVCNPVLLVLDEPTANVDSAVGARLLDLLHELNGRMTILMVSHDLRFVSGHVSKVVCVNRTVNMHPTSYITGEIIKEVYGADVRVILHDHDEPAGVHKHG